MSFNEVSDVSQILTKDSDLCIVEKQFTHRRAAPVSKGQPVSNRPKQTKGKKTLKRKCRNTQNTVIDSKDVLVNTRSSTDNQDREVMTEKALQEAVRSTTSKVTQQDIDPNQQPVVPVFRKRKRNTLASSGKMETEDEVTKKRVNSCSVSSFISSENQGSGETHHTSQEIDINQTFKNINFMNPSLPEVTDDLDRSISEKRLSKSAVKPLKDIVQDLLSNSNNAESMRFHMSCQDASEFPFRIRNEFAADLSKETTDTLDQEQKATCTIQDTQLEMIKSRKGQPEESPAVDVHESKDPRSVDTEMSVVIDGFHADDHIDNLMDCTSRNNQHVEETLCQNLQNVMANDQNTDVKHTNNQWKQELVLNFESRKEIMKGINQHLKMSKQSIQERDGDLNMNVTSDKVTEKCILVQNNYASDKSTEYTVAQNMNNAHDERTDVDMLAKTMAITSVIGTEAATLVQFFSDKSTKACNTALNMNITSNKSTAFGIVALDMNVTGDTSTEFGTVAQNMNNANDKSTEVGTVTHNMNNASDNSTEVGTVAHNMHNAIDTSREVGTVAHNMNNVSDNSTEVGTVAHNMNNASDNSTEVGTVAHNMNNASDKSTEVGTVAQDMTSASTVAQSMNNASDNSTEVGTVAHNMNNASDNSTEVSTVANKMNTASDNSTEVGTVAQNMENASDNSTEVGTMAHNMNSASDNSTEVGTMAHNMNNASDNSTEVGFMAHNMNNAIDNSTEVGTVAHNMNNASENSTEVGTVAHNMNNASDNSTEVGTMAHNMNNASDNSTEVGTMAHNMNNASDNSTEMGTVAQNMDNASVKRTEIGTVAQNTETNGDQKTGMEKNWLTDSFTRDAVYELDNLDLNLDLSDSQICELQGDFIEDTKDHNQISTIRSCAERKPFLMVQPTDGTTIVRGIIQELSQLNTFVLRMKRNIEAAKRQNFKSRRIQSNSADVSPSWPFCN